MILQELVHELFLPIQTRKKLFSCVKKLEDFRFDNPGGRHAEYLKSTRSVILKGNVCEAVKRLVAIGETGRIDQNDVESFWDDLLWVSHKHKLRQMPYRLHQAQNNKETTKESVTTT
ncbi:hypothetical protein [Pleionea sp. CnH1-48]|uniref:hypothetical protein n=1 Tax=Pleionea sp. CnH1-48 TaxID=2954494 RepID=UPI002098625B|nr:hypothetical protein [Pleionea sp. CnH1-48]MCO7224179.1 hypothetical protein [Pleionea sp. CnH1-48]